MQAAPGFCFRFPVVLLDPVDLAARADLLDPLDGHVAVLSAHVAAPDEAAPVASRGLRVRHELVQGDEPVGLRVVLRTRPRGLRVDADPTDEAAAGQARERGAGHLPAVASLDEGDADELAGGAAEEGFGGQAVDGEDFVLHVECPVLGV